MRVAARRAAPAPRALGSTHSYRRREAVCLSSNFWVVRRLRFCSLAAVVIGWAWGPTGRAVGPLVYLSRVVSAGYLVVLVPEQNRRNVRALCIHPSACVVTCFGLADLLFQQSLVSTPLGLGRRFTSVASIIKPPSRQYIASNNMPSGASRVGLVCWRDACCLTGDAQRSFGGHRLVHARASTKIGAGHYTIVSPF